MVELNGPRASQCQGSSRALATPSVSKERRFRGVRTAFLLVGRSSLNWNVAALAPLTSAARCRGPRIASHQRPCANSRVCDQACASHRCSRSVLKPRRSVVKQRRDHSGPPGPSGNPHSSSALGRSPRETSGASHLHGHYRSGRTLDGSKTGRSLAGLAREASRQEIAVEAARPPLGTRLHSRTAEQLPNHER